MNKIFFFLPLFLLCCISLKAQQKTEQNKKFFISAGYGLSGSFIANGKEESSPFSPTGYRAFFNKNFIGSAQNISIGFRSGKKYEIKMGINFQHFTRRIKAQDTIGNVVINLNSTIHQRDYIYFLNANRIFETKKHLLKPGLGIYFLRTIDQGIEWGNGIPNFVSIREYRKEKTNHNEEAGVFIEFAYEYKFQPKVNLGIKAQFYYTLSAAYAESVTLFPYIKILF